MERRAPPAWQTDEMADDPGQRDVVAYMFPTPGLLGELELQVPVSLAARTGAWCFDTMTVLGEGTWQAARAAADTALTAADLVLAGASAAYACCRLEGLDETR